MSTLNRVLGDGTIIDGMWIDDLHPLSTML